MIKTINDSKHYSITLTKRVDVETAAGNITLYPGRTYTVRGDVLKNIKTSVIDAKAI